MVFIVSLFLFRRASGTLNIGKINVVSYTYYLFLVQTFLGTVLIALGFDKHYTLQKLTSPQSSNTVTFYVVMSTMLLLPLVMLAAYRIARINPSEAYDRYLKAPVKMWDDDRPLFVFVCVGGGICLLLLAVFLFKIGYIPLLAMIKTPEGLNLATERVRVGRITVISEQVRNILILQFIPLVSYITFSFALSTRRQKWILLAFLFFAASVITKTYNFSKAPIVFHLFIYVLIYLYYKGGIKWQYVLVFVALMAGVMVLLYLALGYQDSFLDLYNGIFGRTIFTQVGTLTYNFDLFPAVFPFLHGRSFAASILPVLGMKSGDYLRSAKLIMDFYGSDKVYDGTAGVMNSVFLGEAYANFGYIGIVFSIVWVGAVLALLFILMVKLQKNPVTITMTAVLASKVALMSQGGFTDFIYNADLIITLVGMLVLNKIPDIYRWVAKKYFTKKQKSS